MKKILIVSILLLTLGFAVGCEDDYVAPYGDYSSFSWYTAEGIAKNFNTTEKNINIDNYIGFYDVSQNAVSHKWTIPSSCKFLNKEFTEADSVYTSFIIPGTVSNEDLANVLFVENGLQEINLVNVFNDSVPNSSKLLDGTWVIEQSFMVDVYANPNPECKILYKGEEVFVLTADMDPSIEEMSSWPTLTIEAGEELVYLDMSTIGRPTGRKFTLEGAKPETSSKEESIVKYNKLGTFTGSMESIRSDEDIPSKTISKLIPLKIEVTPSSAPFVQTGKITVENNVILLSVTGEVEKMVKQEEFFTAHVINTTAGFDENIAIKTAKINALDATIIELTLSEPIYNTDEITLSFAGGEIVSVDSRVLAEFGPESVSIPLGNSVLVDTWAGFETFKDNWKSANCTGYWVGNTNDDSGSKTDPIFNRVEDKFYEGTASMRYKFDISKVIGLQGSDFSKPNGLPAASYRISFMVYLEPGNTMKMFRTILQNPFTILYWDVENLPRGEWVEVSQVLEVPAIASGTKHDIKIEPEDNPGVTGEQIIYFDSQKWIPLDPR